jgi:lambda family phage portal protein
MSGQKRTFANKMYNKYTSLVGGALSMISPARAAGFVYGRQMFRSFAAGSATGMDANFRPRLRSGDADVKRAYKLVAARCRDQAQNNSVISGSISRICDNVVRSGIFPKFQFRTRDGKLDKEANKAWRALFQRWSLYCDITGHDTYGGLQKLGLRHMWPDGQYLIHRVYDTSRPGIVPLRLELLEYDQLDSLVDGVQTNGNVARKGIEYDPNTARPLAYHVLDHHPGDYLALGRRMTSRRIPASEIYHVWDRRQISQHSGIAWMVAVVMESYRMEDFRHITQDTARLQSTFAGFLKSAFPGFQLGGGLGLGGQTSAYKPGDTGATAPPTEIKNGIIQALPSGTDVTFASPTQPGNNYEPFVKDSQRFQSVGMNMSFESFSNNYTESSFSSNQASALESRLSYRGQQHFLEMGPNRQVVAWFIEAAYLAGLAPSSMPNYAKDPDFYHEMAVGQFPGWGGINQLADAKAAAELIELGLDTHHNQAARIGNDWDENVDELIDEEEKMVKLAELRAKRKALEEGIKNAATN